MKMKYIVSITYAGTIDMKVEAPNQEVAEDAALDEIGTWPEALFLERLNFQIDRIEFRT
jgi:hypothetical protein